LKLEDENIRPTRLNIDTLIEMGCPQDIVDDLNQQKDELAQKLQERPKGSALYQETLEEIKKLEKRSGDLTFEWW
jgi:hypothetical protein